MQEVIALNRKLIILENRTKGLLKGHRPAIVFLKKNQGKIYEGGAGDFIMSIGKDALHFQRLSMFTKKLVPEKDFMLPLHRIKSYHLRTVNIITNCLTLYTTEKFYIEISYNTKTPDSYESEMNIQSILKILKERNIMEMKL